MKLFHTMICLLLAIFPIDYIAGTSMGAIVGGLYAIGYSATEIDSMVASQDWQLLLSNGII